MMRNRKNLLLVAVLVLVAGPVLAQSDGFALTGINFNFTNPGARARGIGGAFVAIADDSTAALANPAGIAYLVREVTVEGVRDEEQLPVGQLTQGGVTTITEPLSELYLPATDPYRVRASSDQQRLNYASLVLPVIKSKLTFAAYYAVLADMESRFGVPASVICIDANGQARLPGAGEQCRFSYTDPASDLPSLYFGQQVMFSLTTRLYGAALGYRVSDSLSLGLSLAYGETIFNGVAVADRQGLAGDLLQLSQVDDSDLVYTVGLLYRADRWGFGLSYRSSSGYRTVNSSSDVEQLDLVTSFGGELTVPERLAVGVALFPSDAWVISAELTRIPYSDLLSKMVPFNPTVADNLDLNYRISDVTEYHLGAEYSTFADQQGWSLRFGYWRDRTHLPWFNEQYQDARQEIDSLRAQESLIRQRFDQDVDHFTAGIGLSIGTRFRIDAAVDYTEQSGNDLLLSGVFYF